MTRVVRSILAVVVALACCGALIAAAPLLGYGAGAMQWVIRPTPASGAAPATWTIATREGKRLVDVASLGREPAQLATFGDRLAILSLDGGWSLASSDGVVVGPALPNDHRPVAIASGRGLLWFLVGHGDGRALMTWDGRTFDDAGAVPDARPPALDARLLVTRTGVIVASRVADGVQIATQDGDAAWRTAGAPIAADRAWLAQDERRGPLLIAEANGTWTIRTIARDGTPGAAATLAADAAARAASPSIVDGDVRLDWADGDRIAEQAFDSSNRVVGPPTLVQPVSGATARTPSTFDRAASWIGMLAMAVVLLTVGRPRGDEPPGRRDAKDATPAPASLARRLAAGLIDAWPLYAACAAVVLSSDLPDAELMRLDAPRDRAIVIAGALAYVLVGCLSEWRWQRTLGKLLFGLRVVVDATGARPPLRAILIRNALRVLDLNLVTLLIVPLSRQRQRLGDLVAGTLVVEATPDRAATTIDADHVEGKR